MPVTEPYQIPLPSAAVMASLARSMALEMRLPPDYFLGPRKAPPPPPPPQPIPPKTVEDVAKMIPESRAYPPLEAIMRAVSIATKVPLMELRSERRFVPAARARAIFYYCARELTPKSLPAIGKACGGRDHSTILHGIGKVKAHRQAFEPELSTVISALKREEPQ